MATKVTKKVVAPKKPIEKKATVGVASTKKVEEVPSKTEGSHGVSASVVGVDGKAKGKMQLPQELFGLRVNRDLIAQAVRVYLANQRVGTASTKTRGEVEGSTRKIYRQKGTGRARHGGIRAPIFVGGGITFGPKPRDYHLDLPKKMRRAALGSALSSQFASGNIVIVDGMESLPAKTKDMAKTLGAVGATVKTLLITAPQSQSVARSAKNISFVEVLPANLVHAYAVLAHQKIVLMKNAVSVLKDTFIKS